MHQRQHGLQTGRAQAEIFDAGENCDCTKETAYAIGMALTEEIFPVLRGDPGERDLLAGYNERLKRLTAAEWRSLAEDDGRDEG